MQHSDIARFDAAPSQAPSPPSKAYPVGLEAKRLVVSVLILGSTTSILFGDVIAANWNAPQWEDPKFFQYVQQFHSSWDAFASASAWQGLYRPLSTNWIYYHGQLWLGQDVRGYHRTAHVTQTSVGQRAA